MKVFLFIGILFVFISCANDGLSPSLLPEQFASIPAGFPAMVYPEDNAYTRERWLLGKKLFYDTRLSRTNTLSCGSCHKPELAFSDDISKSPGVENRPGTRNTPSLTNIGYHPYFTREGGVPTLEMQVLVPIQEHNEFDFNIIEIAERLKIDRQYQSMSHQAYDREFDYYVITRALANFERTLISGNTRYDQYTFQNKSSALNPEELAGMNLFFSTKTNCSACHSGFNFSNYTFENNGLYEQYADPGRNRLTGNEKDLALFKVPSLRNIALTAPYMHDGAIQTLEDVIAHYDSGGKNHLHKSPLVKPLDLTSIEKEQLIAFLLTLTDYDFITNPDFKP